MKLEGKIKASDATRLHLAARENSFEGFLARMILELNVEISKLKDEINGRST